MIDLNECDKSTNSIKNKYTMSPSFIDLFVDVWNTMTWYYSPNISHDDRLYRPSMYDSLRNLKVDYIDIYCIGWIAVFFTFIRYIFEQNLCRKLIDWLELTATNEKKFSESTWKLLFYTCTWFYCLYLIKYRYDYFDEPYLIWDNWSAGMPIPFDIKILYFVQCGFYIHSIYATLYMDLRRKDFSIMIIHHLLTIALLSVSYAIRYHKVGLLVLFCHDIADIWLELTKITRYLLSRQGGRQCPQWARASEFGFSLLTTCWLIFRLYWYPLKVLYTTGVVSVYRTSDTGLHLYLPFYILLWILLALNIYWFFLILKVLKNALLGCVSEAGDVREDDEDT